MSAIASKYTKYTKEAKKDLSKVGKSAKKVYKKVASKKNVAAVKKTVSKVEKYASKAGHAVVDKLAHLRFADGGEVSDDLIKQYADKAIHILKAKKEDKTFEYSDIDGVSRMYAMELADQITKTKSDRQEQYKKLYPELKAKILPLVEQAFPQDAEMANFDFEGLFAPGNKEEEVLIEKTKANKIAYKDFLSRVNAVKDVIQAFARSANQNKLDYDNYQSWIAHVKEAIDGLRLLGGAAAKYADSIEHKFDSALKAHDFGKHEFIYAKGGIVPLSDLPSNTVELVDARKVTYRGTGNSGESKIKVNGKEYVISSEDFDALGGLEKIRFSAPFRKAENGGEVPIDDDDTTILEISNTNPLSTQLQKLTGDSWNVWDFESVDGGNLTTEKPFRHKKTGKVFKVKEREYAEGGAALTRDQEIAKEILDQLGGRNKLHAMTGAYDFFAIPRGLVFKIKNPKANYIKIVLNANDTYDIEIGRIRKGSEYKVVAQGDGYYDDMLVPFIEKSTGMYLRFEEGGETERPKPKTYHQWLQMITDEYSRDESAMPSKMELSNMYDAYLRENFNPEPFYYKMVANRWVPMNTLPTEKDWEMYRSIQIYDEDGNGGMKIKGIGLY